MERRINPITVFFPSSILSDVPSLSEKTFKVGQIARAASIFRVEKLVIYPDGSKWRQDARLIHSLLSYAETPQYLRKILFPISPQLRFAGLIPPLRTPHHPLESSDVDYREGIVLESGAKGSLIDIGLREPVRCRIPMPRNSRVTMRREEGAWVPVPRDSVPLYWGYAVQIEQRPLREILSERHSGVIIATSRLGTPVSQVAGRISRAFSDRRSISLIFGSPREGLHEILAREGASLEDLVDMTINLAPDQGTATIRTEEAIMIALALIDFIGGSAGPTESKDKPDNL
ncbi:MAG: putative RNA uridine N3 methyltransferase [Candidatus Methanosuratincola verstraetei]|jgi:predicted SPOUT superfamily RNA methylase MTH1|uniref:RNA-binding protein n=1 Tax=Methanosuratincola subterraneus TaxID=2593994 RepID=A0A3S3REL5_METS7|nr:MAG: RNA-binding protein [Candidatus Methanosuratincola subterraneus]